MWVRPEDDPRGRAPAPTSWPRSGNTWTDFRATLRRQCDDLTPEQLATRSVPPSTLSLLGLVRHMAPSRAHLVPPRCCAGTYDALRLYRTEEDPDLDFNGAVADPAVVDDAFTSWRQQIADADAWLDELTDLDAMVVVEPGDEASVRDILIHMIEEYARHCGHADLLRECIDGRTGQ